MPTIAPSINIMLSTFRISMNDYKEEEWVTNVPLYAVDGFVF